MPRAPSPQPIPARPPGGNGDLAPLRRSKPVANFYFALSLLIALLISAIYVGIYQRNKALMMSAIRDEAASYFDLIVRARRWNASYGGVFVEKKAGVELTVPELRQHARNMASYMRPLHYVILEPGQMPLNRSAKVDYVRLSEMAREEVAKLRAARRWDR